MFFQFVYMKMGGFGENSGSTKLAIFDLCRAEFSPPEIWGEGRIPPLILDFISKSEYGSYRNLHCEWYTFSFFLLSCMSACLSVFSFFPLLSNSIYLEEEDNHDQKKKNIIIIRRRRILLSLEKEEYYYHQKKKEESIIFRRRREYYYHHQKKENFIIIIRRRTILIYSN